MNELITLIQTPSGMLMVVAVLWFGYIGLKELRKEDKTTNAEKIVEINARITNVENIVNNRITNVENNVKMDLKDHSQNCNLKTDLINLKSNFAEHKQDIQRIYTKIDELKELIIQSLQR